MVFLQYKSYIDQSYPFWNKVRSLIHESRRKKEFCPQELFIINGCIFPFFLIFVIYLVNIRLRCVFSLSDGLFTAKFTGSET